MGEMRRLTPARKKKNRDAALTRTQGKSGAGAHAERKGRDDQRGYEAQM